MKTASSSFKTAIAAETSSIIRLWKIKTRGGTEYRLTDSDETITIASGEASGTYLPTEGFEASAVVSETGGGMQGLSVSFALSPLELSINRRRIYEATMDSADTTLFAYNRQNAGGGVTILFKGRIDEITFDNIGNVTFELIGRVASGQSNLQIERYSATCRADFGDKRCKILLDAHTALMTVTGVTSQKIILSTDLTHPDGTFAFGFIEFTSGRNLGIIMEVAYTDLATKAIVSMLDFPGKIEIGDTFRVTRGCDKTITSCRAYNNLLNFRGEPFAPVPQEVPPVI